ncbi:uncharacterized protein SPPG_07354 [Spizellomyces punctatus DAOM BR117]|uniref:NAD(P)-binding domain-containing protein n=1 Tax=Spizellomyces punctatus (strain DAOM BR117) TaxID=645134 RepID=A0A0L0H8V3_SPIPD|nr:uncharacterized protein SPPG_07354 [Spizellomyces punctatus DAOM BR117]KNC97431.1 hypothetical protein SPPG_07354 [Spizellomyces punctatus DAOM BR117]|eukprot:XP_016605471.1 hypothetical protein SPPG_07354 [Spizellomyces punctatus DAOM BR117]
MSSTTKVVASATAALSAADAAATTAFKAGKHAAIIMGATGAVGKALVREVMEADAFEKVTLLLRREVEYEGPHSEKLTQKKVDFENLEESVFAGHDVMFCTFGTTRAQAGSAEAFQKIDRDYVLNAAKLFKSANPTTPLHFLYTSSGGANASSWLLYPRTKGEIENGLKSMNFAKCSIFRPGFLVLEEERRGSRFAEDMVAPILGGAFGRWTGLSTPVGSCARAMRRWAVGGGEGITVEVKDGTYTIENKDILKMGA